MKVFINPGHSKNCKPDCGATGFGKYEAVIAAEIGEKLFECLRQQGITSVVHQQYGNKLTANQQLNEVPRKANASGADLFLSIHLNAASASAKGTETLYAKGSKNGKKFAELVNAELTKPFTNYTLTNRGAKEDVRNLLVLRATSMPAALVEVGFISNKEDNEFICTHTSEIAQRLCTAICKYYGVAQKSTIAKAKQEFKLEHVDEDNYDLYVNGTLVLAANKFSTCVEYLEKHHGV